MYKFQNGFDTKLKLVNLKEQVLILPYDFSDPVKLKYMKHK